MAGSGSRVADLFGLEGRIAVVTGGSRGIGFMIAQGLLEAGAEVIISARKAEACVTAAEELSAFGTCTALPGDVSTPEGCTALASAITDRSDMVHILVNNAGASWGAPIEEYPSDGWDKVMNTNVRGVFQLSQALLPNLRSASTEDNPSRIINIGSVDGLRSPSMDSYAYGASKAAVHHLTRHMARRFQRENITVNAIAPGPFESKMMAFALSDEDSRAAVAASVPMGRIGQPDDMAGAAIYLASRAGSYLTGTVLPVAGGVGNSLS